VFSRKVHDLRHLGFSDLVCKNAAFADPVMMNMQHDRRRGFNVLVEELLQNMNNELHRSVVVVQDQHAVEVRALGLGLDLGNDGRACPPPPLAAAIILAHSRAGASGLFAGHLGRRDWFRI